MSAILPGIYPDISNEDYHAGPGISKTGLMTILNQSPAHYKFGEKPQTKPQAMGELVHAAILEPHKIGSIYIPGPKVNKNTNEWKAAAAAAQQTGRVICDADNYADAMRMADRLRADPTIAAILAASPKIEHSAYAADQEFGELVRCRPDIAISGLLCDVKSIESAGIDNITKHIQAYSYHAQAAIYPDVWERAGGGKCAFVFIFTEKREPFEYRLVELDDDFLAIGQRAYREAMAIYAECQRTQVWPGYARGVEKVSPARWFANRYKESEYE